MGTEVSERWGGERRKKRASRVGGGRWVGRSARASVRAYLLASSSRLALELGSALVGGHALASARLVLVVLVRPRVDPHVSARRRVRNLAAPVSVLLAADAVA